MERAGHVDCFVFFNGENQNVYFNLMCAYVCRRACMHSACVHVRIGFGLLAS